MIPSSARCRLKTQQRAAEPSPKSPAATGSAPAGEAPAARIRRAGGHALSDAEVVAVVLGGGRGSERELALARELLADGGGLAALPSASQSLLRYAGLRASQAAALLAACEMACRLARRCMPLRCPMSRPEDLARYLTLRYRQRDQEVMGAVFLDLRRGLIGEKEIFLGTMSRAAVEPREILKECLLRGAAAVALFHTHPSGVRRTSGLCGVEPVALDPARGWRLRYSA